MKYKIYNYIVGFFSLAIITGSCVSDEDLIQVDPNNNALDSFWKTDSIWCSRYDMEIVY